MSRKTLNAVAMMVLVAAGGALASPPPAQTVISKCSSGDQVCYCSRGCSAGGGTCRCEGDDL